MIRVKLSQNPYKILVGENILYHLPKLIAQKNIFLIADRKLSQTSQKIMTLFQKENRKISKHLFKVDESIKRIESVYPLYEKMLKAGLDRNSIVLALGGGVIGDLSGFVASTYMRGIPWVGIPTTLLAQVDSSIGGKTGINHERGKNLIGSFWQPSLVISDTSLLKTLPKRDIHSGLAEVIKYGLLFDEVFFRFLEKNFNDLVKLDEKVIVKAVAMSSKFKAQVIERDEFEKFGLRELLNLGHTFAHALENQTQYGVFRHGEAVLMGMQFASALSVVKRVLPLQKFERIQHFLSSIKRPPFPKSLTIKSLYQATRFDKKKSQGKTKYILLKDIGSAYSRSDISYEEFKQAVELSGVKK